MSDLNTIQSEMFKKGNLMVEMAEVFGALASDCRIEIIYLLNRVESLPSGEIARLTNCTPSQISQYLSKMYDAGLLEKHRSWREVTYSLKKENPFIQGILSVLSLHLGITQ